MAGAEGQGLGVQLLPPAAATCRNACKGGQHGSQKVLVLPARVRSAEIKQMGSRNRSGDYKDALSSPRRGKGTLASEEEAEPEFALSNWAQSTGTAPGIFTWNLIFTPA